MAYFSRCNYNVKKRIKVPALYTTGLILVGVPFAYLQVISRLAMAAIPQLSVLVWLPPVLFPVLTLA
jgi:hypothetical protein